MKKIIACLLIVLLLAPSAMASFSSDVVVIDKKEIAKLTDDQLMDQYLNTVVEVEANKAFHSTSGFSPQDYKDYKALIKFRLLLLMEIHSRNLEIPQFDRSL
jgi:hypothetical protein